MKVQRGFCVRHQQDVAGLESRGLHIIYGFLYMSIGQRVDRYVLTPEA
jgi:hypothetical protein